MVFELLWFGAGSPRGCYAGPGAGHPACIAGPGCGPPAGGETGGGAGRSPGVGSTCRTGVWADADSRAGAGTDTGSGQEAVMEPVPEQDVAGMSAPELVLCPEVTPALCLPLVPKVAFALELAQQPALLGLLLRTRYENCCCRRLWL